MKTIRDHWLWLLVMAGWILLGLWLINCASSKQSLFHGDPLFDLENPKECLSHFMVLFANLEQGGEQGFNVSEQSVGTKESGSEKYAASRVTESGMRWITMICYLDDEESKRYVYECAEARAPCPIQDVMQNCNPKEKTHGVQPE